MRNIVRSRVQFHQRQFPRFSERQRDEGREPEQHPGHRREDVLRALRGTEGERELDQVGFVFFVRAYLGRMLVYIVQYSLSYAERRCHEIVLKATNIRCLFCCKTSSGMRFR